MSRFGGLQRIKWIGRQRHSAAAGCALYACLFLAGPTTAASNAVEVPIGGQLRDAALLGLNGPGRRLSAFRGRPLMINVWASWCGPCRREMASLERLAWSDERRYFAIIGISTDDHADQARALLLGTHATISQFIDRELEMEHMLGASRLPLTVLVSADGRILLKVYGAREWDSPETLALIDATFRQRMAAHASIR